ncbi:hypothetical protein A1D22_02215 [Pasteurellaceae bacterium LFhippo2]|nr:hypothetical protein [Pasteurellaceae bacterium LFhippo2]
MAKKAINFRPNIGDILECDFGRWSEIESFDGHIPPEMRKRRMVIVINSRLDGKSSLVVPISSNESNSTNAKYIECLPPELFKVTHFYDSRVRYALCNRLTMISNRRLFSIYDNHTLIKQKLPNEVITAIQIKIIKAINAQSLINEISDLKEKISQLEQEIIQLRLNNN